MCQKIMGEVNKQKLSLSHGEEMPVQLIDTMLPERLEIKAYFEKNNQTLHRIMVNKFMKSGVVLHLKPVIEKRFEYKILLMSKK